MLPTRLRGANGVCLITDGLVYLDWNRVWAQPFYHAFYYGLTKRFFEYVYPSSGARAATDYVLQPGGLTRPADQPLMLNYPSDELKPPRWVLNLLHERMYNMVSDMMEVLTCDAYACGEAHFTFESALGILFLMDEQRI